MRRARTRGKPNVRDTSPRALIPQDGHRTLPDTFRPLWCPRASGPPGATPTPTRRARCPPAGAGARDRQPDRRLPTRLHPRHARVQPAHPSRRPGTPLAPANRLGREKSRTCSSTSTTRSTGSPGAGGLCPRPRRKQTHLPQHRLLHLPLVPCHGTGVVRGAAPAAELLNRHFVSIKVDREERPDVDRIYMTYVQARTGSGGWPLNVFLTPDLKPFFGGTYSPPADHQRTPRLSGRPPPARRHLGETPRRGPRRRQ